MKALLIIGGIIAGAGALYLYDQNTGGGITKAVESAFDPVDALAEAIATAEGFYVNGSRPQRNHNPGDMTVDIVGRGVGMDGPFVVYSDDGDGWDNLKAQISKWFDGSSKNADSTSTIGDLSSFYTSTEQDSWAANVAHVLGVSTDTPISQLGQGS